MVIRRGSNTVTKPLSRIPEVEFKWGIEEKTCQDVESATKIQHSNHERSEQLNTQVEQQSFRHGGVPNADALALVFDELFKPASGSTNSQIFFL